MDNHPFTKASLGLYRPLAVVFALMLVAGLVYLLSAPPTPTKTVIAVADADMSNAMIAITTIAMTAMAIMTATGIANGATRTAATPTGLTIRSAISMRSRSMCRHRSTTRRARRPASACSFR